jgi:diacylglycerol O-acyltransferase
MTVTAYAPRMNDQDALMWHIERDPLLRSTMVGVMVLDRALDPERFERSLENLVRAMPRFRQRAEPDPLSIAPPRWEPDPWFNLSFHVARVTAPGLGTRRDVLDLASKLAMDSFDLARPLWRLVIVDGLDEGRSALILKLHHSVTDAVGFFRVLGNLVQMGPDDAISVADEVPAGSRSTRAKRVLAAAGYRVQVTGRDLAAMPGRISGAARALLDAPASALSMIASLVRVFRPEFRPKSTQMRGRSLNTRLDTITFPLDPLRAAAKGAGGKLNDAFLAGLAGGLARYHEAHGQVPRELRVNMPINFRGSDADGEGGNHFIPARFLLPIGTSDPSARIREASEVVGRVRSEPAMAKFGAVVSALDVFPALARPLFGLMLKSVDLNASNVPGPPVRLYCAGAEIEEMYPATPLGGAAVSVSLLSYAGTVHVTINSDTGAVDDVDRLVDCLRAGFEEVLASAEMPVLEATQ